MLNFLTCISTTFSKQAVKALARLCVCAWADSEGDMGSGPRLCVCAWADSEGGMGSGPRLCVCAWADSEGGMGSGPPPEKSQNYRVF